MEKARIAGTSHVAVRHVGNLILTVETPTVTGDTPAAEHLRMLLAALIDFARGRMAESAKDDLLTAAAERRLFSFTPHKCKVILAKQTVIRGTLFTLTLTLTANGTVRHTAHRFLWNTDETLRKKYKRRAARRTKARKKG